MSLNLRRNRIIYNAQGLYVGPAPASEYHFLDGSGVLNNRYTDLLNNNNLIVPVTRLTSFNYSINVDRTEIKTLGVQGLVSRPSITPPTVDFSFTYDQVGIINESRLGFYANYTKPESNYSGQTLYDNFNTCFISGFIVRDPNFALNRAENTLRWPYNYRDKRNFFLAVKQNNDDLNTQNSSIPSSIDVFAFGNSYVTNYKTSASVGSFPQATVSYTAENLIYYSSGSGIAIPALDAQTRLPILGVNAVIPALYQSGLSPAVLHPGDITLNISGLNRLSGSFIFQNTGNFLGNSFNPVGNECDLSRMSVQSYSINLDLKREALYSIDYKLPLDRRIVFPVYADLNLNLLISDMQTGSLSNLVNSDYDYNIKIKVQNPPGNLQSGTALQYDFVRAKFNGMQVQSQVGSNRTASMSFNVEINPEKFSQGFFVSGLLNQYYQLLFDNVLAQAGGVNDGDALLQENGDLILSDSYGFYY